MKSFKQQLTENKFADMPMSILKNKTAGILQDHGHDAASSEHVRSQIPTEDSKTVTYKFHYNGDDHDDLEASDDRFHEIHSKLHEHGWERSPHHDLSINTSDGGAHVVTYTHPNGAVLHHVTAYNDGDWSHQHYELKHKG